MQEYKVLVVDDEPLAVKAICKIIERSCPEFVVAGEASNGREGLEKIEEVSPDLVITDIAMPLMNGLAMARLAAEAFPGLCFAVISGYQDYEYMREAIRSGVLDYLAKPIVPSVVISMMNRIREKLDHTFYQERNRLLRKISQGAVIPEQTLSRYFRHRRFYAALIRENGLPRRFSRMAGPELFGTEQEVFCVYGRDSMEQLFLIPASILGGQPIVDYMQKIGARQRRKDSYMTLVYYGSAFGSDQIGEKIEGLYRALNRISTVGKNQSVDLDRSAAADSGAAEEKEELDALLAELKGYGLTRQDDRFYSRLFQALDTWEKEERPQYWLENAARRLMQFMLSENRLNGSLLDIEYLLEDMFYEATDMKMLRASLENVFLKAAPEGQEQVKVDSPEYFNGIGEYLKRNLDKSLSLQSLSEEFAISQAYMSRLFRKYAGQSYSQYLTALRMERAKQLMQENPGMYVKDVARLTGYQDQFYFSRIFRSCTGKSPADYLKQNT